MCGVYQCRGFLLFIKGTYSLKKKKSLLLKFPLAALGDATSCIFDGRVGQLM
uniref:Uncharacterized protein n=1 Tax=Anguilla anguilla TaxID=7936 RepID=A0A0E9RZW4_ANGAN